MESPNTLDELLDRVPGLRKRRSLDAATLRQLLDRPKRACTWCGKPVPARSSKWCGSVCVYEFRSRCDSAHQAAEVTRRDAGICQICGRDTFLSERVWRHYVRQTHDRGPDVAGLLGYGRGQWREVDHARPVCEGGGLCGITGLRLLCGACHDSETDALNRRRKQKTKEHGRSANSRRAPELGVVVR